MRKPSADRNGTHEKSPSSSAPPRSAMLGETMRVLLSEIDLEDMKFQFRIGMRAADLRVSMRDQGQQRPVDLRRSSPPYQLIDGFRRCAAARSLGWPSVLATIHDDLDDLHAFKLAFTRNVVRKNPTSVERANAIRVGMEGGMTKAGHRRGDSTSRRSRSCGTRLWFACPPRCWPRSTGSCSRMGHALAMKNFEVGNAAQVIVEVKARKLTIEQLGKPPGMLDPRKTFRMEFAEMRSSGYAGVGGARRRETKRIADRPRGAWSSRVRGGVANPNSGGES